MRPALSPPERSRSLARFFHDPGGSVVLRQDRGKLILRSDAVPGIGVPLLIKIYRQGSAVERLCESLTRSRGERSLAVGRRLAERGVPVPEPYGAATERGRSGLVARSLVATVWRGDMTSLRDLAIAVRRGNGEDRHDVRLLCRTLGRFVAGLHERGVWAPDMNTGNFLVRRQGAGPYEIMLVDHDDVRFARSITRKRRVTNLSQLAAALLALEDGAPSDICEGYCADGERTKDNDDLARAVEVRARAVLDRWERGLAGRFERIGAARKRSRDDRV
jgi:tRNA A-37 threonylcarbamoyl transferase component Bud32